MRDEEQDADERAGVLEKAFEGALEVAEEPVMPVPAFPTFHHTPTLPHQLPGNGFESGRDSRAR